MNRIQLKETPTVGFLCRWIAYIKARLVICRKLLPLLLLFPGTRSPLSPQSSLYFQYPEFSTLRKLSKNIILTVEVHLITINLNLGATILGKEDSIASLESRNMKVTGNVANARSDGNYLALIGALGLVRGEVDTTGSLSLLGRSSDQDPITEGGKGASESLYSLCNIQ